MRWGIALLSILAILGGCQPLAPPAPPIPDGTVACASETITTNAGYSADGRACFHDGYVRCAPVSFSQTDASSKTETVFWTEKHASGCVVHRALTKNRVRTLDCVSLDFYTRTLDGKDMDEFSASAKTCPA